MSLKIAETTFITTQDSGLAAVDAYEKQAQDDSGIISLIGAISPDFESPNIQEKIGDVTSIFEDYQKNYFDVKGTVDKITGIVKNKDKLVDNLRDAISTDVLTHVGLGKYAGDITDVIAGRRDPETLLGSVVKHNPKIKLAVGGVEQLVKLKDIESFEGTIDLLKQVTGNSELAEVLDLGPDFLVMSELLDQASKTRIPELVDSVISTIDEYQTDRVLISGIPRVVNNSDLYTLQKIEDFIGDGGVVSAYPQVIKKIMQNYKVKEGDEVTVDNAKDFEQALSRIKPDWWLTTRLDSEVINFALFEGMSNDAFTSLSMLDGFKDFVPVCQYYSPKDIKTVVKQTKPWVAMA